MNTAEKIKVMQAYLDGEEIEYNKGSGWITLPKSGEPCWNWASFDYRIKGQDYPLDIPWEWIEEKWKCAAMDEDGEIYFYTEHPELRTDYWAIGFDDVTKIDYLKIKKPDTKHWDKTLTKRPEWR